MAWNEPGDSGNKDPWGNRKNNEQGPPDLDELLRKLQQTFKGLFGAKRAEGGGGSSKSVGGPGLSLLAILVVVVWLLSGIYIVNPAEQGVVLQFGKYSVSKGPGPHWHLPYPIETVKVVNVNQIQNIEVGIRSDGLKQNVSVPDEALMLTQDENIVDVGFSVQYQVKDASAYLFNVNDPDFTLKQVTESAVREIIGRSSVDFVLHEGRDEIQGQSKELIQKILDRYKAGLLVINVNMQNAQPPEEVQQAFQDAVQADADRERLINEANTYSNGVVPTARGDAARRIADANAYKSKVIAQAEGETNRFLQVLDEYKKAPAITRERLYIESIESVMANTGKVLVDVKGGNNLLYLPLDRLTQQRNESATTLPSATAPEAGPKTIPAPTELKDNLRDRSRTRGEP